MFGRIYIPDERDLFYDGADLVVDTYRMSRYWGTPKQAEATACLPYAPGQAWHAWYVSRKTWLPRSRYVPLTAYDFFKAGEVPDTDAATIRGGAKLLVKNKLIRSYFWTQDIDVLANYLLMRGPAILGTVWLEGMMNPSYEIAEIEASGPIMGDHAYVVDGINLRSGMVRIKNSWGVDWGRYGWGYLPMTDLETLLKDRGEACLPMGFGKKWSL